MLFDIFKQMISQENPDYILSLKTAHCGQLCAATCKYAKGDRYFISTTFYTDSWISKDPKGPVGINMINPCEKLEDISTVTELPSKTAWMQYPCISNNDLESFLEKVKSTMLHQFSNILDANPHGDKAYAMPLVTPAPAVLVTIKNGDKLIGTILVFLNNTIHPVFACEQRLYDYAVCMQDLLSGASRPEQIGCVKMLALER